MSKQPSLEIERKYLIALNQSKGDFMDLIKKHCSKLQVYKITQTYLAAEEGERRVRKRVSTGKIEFFYTEKFPHSSMSRVENERRITYEEYEEYLSEADPSLHAINKLRLKFIFEGQTFELDMYPFSKTKAILEIELPSEDTPVHLPPFVHVIKDVTSDKAYKNKNLAKTQAFA